MKADDLSYAGAIKAEKLRGWVRAQDLPGAVQESVATATGSVIVGQRVVYDSESVQADVTNASTFPRDQLFWGWAETFTPNGLPFNAIRCRVIERMDVVAQYRWTTIRVLVRTGASPWLAGSPVVAVGDAPVDPGRTVLSDLTILLKDPVTGLPKTLTAGELGTTYMLGIYAESESGGIAALGEPRGNTANSAGWSYYRSNNGVTDALGQDWVATSSGSNNRLGFAHLLLVGPRIEDIYGPGPAFISSVADVVVDQLGANNTPSLAIPPKIYGVQGREASLYFDGLHLGASTFDHDVTSAIGRQQDERWTWTPAGLVVPTSISVAVHDRISGAALATLTTSARSVASTAGAGAGPTLLVVGDSLINAGVITQTLLDIASTDAMGLTLIGSLGSAPNRHEGRGGYTVADYSTAGRSDYRFTVSGLTTAPALNAADYTIGGTTVRVQEASLSAGAGTITCSLVSGTAPSGSGTMTKANGAAGDATIAFSAVAAISGNPFWIDGVLSFAGYLTARGYSAPTRVAVMLGTNDVFGATTDAAALTATNTALGHLDTLIASIRSAGSFVDLFTPPPGAGEQNAFGANYANGQPRWRYKRNALIYCRALCAKYSTREGDGIFIVPSFTAIDTAHGYPRGTSEPVNSRSSTQIARQNNGVHPNASGYQQIADAYWAMLKCLA